MLARYLQAMQDAEKKMSDGEGKGEHKETEADIRKKKAIIKKMKVRIPPHLPAATRGSNMLPSSLAVHPCV